MVWRVCSWDLSDYLGRVWSWDLSDYLARVWRGLLSDYSWDTDDTTRRNDFASIRWRPSVTHSPLTSPNGHTPPYCYHFHNLTQKQLTEVKN